MAVTTARIIQSTGLESAIGSVASREFGVTSDTERPVIGTTVGGSKYMGTEDLITLTVAAPAALSVLRRSITTIVADTATAGAGISFDIQAGAQVPGYKAMIIVTGPDSRWAAVTYGSGAVRYIPAGTAVEFVWTGTLWVPMGTPDTMPVGMTIASDIELTQTAKDAYIDRSVQKDITAAAAPLLVAKYRAIKAKVLGVTDHAATVSGSVITMPNTPAANALISLLQSDAIVSGYINTGEPANFSSGADYSTASTQRCINVAGIDYAITGVTALSRTITVSGTPASGAQTVSVYTYRVAGAATTARLFRIGGFAGIAAGDAGGEVVGGFRRMDRGQGHTHELQVLNSGPLAGQYVPTLALQNANTINDTAITGNLFIKNPKTDTTNGTPRTGKTTDPRTAGMYFYTYAGILLAAV